MLPPQALAFLQPHHFPRRPFPPALPSTTTNPLVGSVCCPCPPPHVDDEVEDHFPLASHSRSLSLASSPGLSLVKVCILSLYFAIPAHSLSLSHTLHLTLVSSPTTSYVQSLPPNLTLVHSCSPHATTFTLSLSPSPSAPPLIRLSPHLSSRRPALPSTPHQHCYG